METKKGSKPKNIGKPKGASTRNLSDKKKEYVLKQLEKIQGIGKGIWGGEDAQDYINKLRDNDRF